MYNHKRLGLPRFTCREGIITTLVIEANTDGPELEARLNELCAELVADRLDASDYPSWLTATTTEEMEAEDDA